MGNNGAIDFKFSCLFQRIAPLTPINNIKINIKGLNRALKSLSAYKVADLIKIAEKLKLPSEKVKKTDLYDSILETIRW